MPRPNRPSLTRRDIAVAALALVDSSGLDAFSVEAVAANLGIRAPSLYYHFRGRADVLSEVAKLITLEVKIPDPPPPEGWADWFIEFGVRFRRAVLRHPRAALLFLQSQPRTFATLGFERSREVLDEAGVPRPLHGKIFSGLDIILLGGVLTESANIIEKMTTKADGAPTPRRGYSPPTNEKHFRETISSFLHGIVVDNNLSGVP